MLDAFIRTNKKLSSVVVTLQNVSFPSPSYSFLLLCQHYNRLQNLILLLVATTILVACTKGGKVFNLNFISRDSNKQRISIQEAFYFNENAYVIEQ